MILAPSESRLLKLAVFAAALVVVALGAVVAVQLSKGRTGGPVEIVCIPPPFRLGTLHEWLRREGCERWHAFPDPMADKLAALVEGKALTNCGSLRCVILRAECGTRLDSAVFHPDPEGFLADLASTCRWDDY